VIENDISDFQALVTGAILGTLMRADEYGFQIDAEPVTDDDGRYRPAILVTGRVSGEQLVIQVERA
jgi:hypothetical protein